MMRLLYVYLDFTKNGRAPEGYRGHRQCELNFGTEDRFVLERLPGQDTHYRLRHRKRTGSDKIERGFWREERLYNLTAIVGENGTGKSTLMHTILRMVASWYEWPPSEVPFSFACVMERDAGRWYLFQSDDGIRIDTAGVPCETISQLWHQARSVGLDRTKWVYLSNTVFRSDLQQYVRMHPTEGEDGIAGQLYTDPLYDGSLVTSMIAAQEFSGAGQGPLQEQLNTYFNFESYQQARYLFDRNQRRVLYEMRRKGYPVPFPRELELGLRSAVDHLESAARIRESPKDNRRYLLNGLVEWRHAYTAFLERADSAMGIIAELCLNCIANYLTAVRRQLGDQIASRMVLPEDFSSPSGYIEALNSVPVADTSRQNWNSISVILDYWSDCKRYIEFLWNNRSHIRTYWSYRRNGSCHITLGDHPDDILQELMIRFVDLNRAVSPGEYFVLYRWGLSSGESILLRIFTKLRYLLIGRPYDEERTEFITRADARNAALAPREAAIVNRLYNGEKKLCDSVILFLDEADLSFHPEWQRVFVATLAEYLPRLFQDPYHSKTQWGCRDIQIILTTHSPLLLGDLPSASVLYLKKDEEGVVVVDGNRKLQPFGQNLYTLLKDGFYLQHGTIGELARRKIADVLAYTQKIQSQLRSAEFVPVEEKLDDWERQLELHWKKTVQYLPDGIVRGKLEEEIAICREIILRKRNPEARERKKEALRKDIARLERELYDLEHGGEGAP